ncbi:MAG: ribosome-associated translation inhibitor RaiA [Deltaproteobacteria bacterium]|nr:ribosome-associated translation inhibitor RaiA [Deltaproteobacteria bacterium]
MKKPTVPITVTFRHIAPTEPLRKYAEKKLGGIVGLVPGATDAHVILAASSHRHRQGCEVVVHAASSHLTAHEETDDLYAAIDLAAAKLDSQVRKLRGRVVGAPRRSSAALRHAPPNAIVRE